MDPKEFVRIVAKKFNLKGSNQREIVVHMRSNHFGGSLRQMMDTLGRDGKIQELINEGLLEKRIAAAEKFLQENDMDRILAIKTLRWDFGLERNLRETMKIVDEALSRIT